VAAESLNEQIWIVRRIAETLQCRKTSPFSLNILIAFSPRTFSLSSADKLLIRLITSTVLGHVATASPWSKSLPMMML